MAKRECWKHAVGEYATGLTAAAFKRYGSALDDLADRTADWLWDCDYGVWSKPSGNAEVRTYSLYQLSARLIASCEAYRNLPSEAKAKTVKRTPKKVAIAVVEAAKTLAAFFGDHTADVSHVLAGLRRHVVTNPATLPLAPASIPENQRGLFALMQRQNITSATMVAMLQEVSETLGADRRHRGHSQTDRETRLGLELVTALRVATGAPYHYQTGDDREPVGGKPLYEVAVKFMHAAGVSKMFTAETLKSRLEAAKRRTRK